MKLKNKYLKMLISGKSLRKSIAILTATLLFMPQSVSAAYNPPATVSSEFTINYVDSVDAYFEKRDQLLALYADIKSTHEETIKQLTDDLKEEIADGEYDYDLTFESLNENGDPLQSIDYTGTLSIYMACKEYRKSNHLGLLTTFSDIPLLTLSSTPAFIEETVPVRVTNYAKQENGTYLPQSTRYTTKKECIPEYTKNADGSYTDTGSTITVAPKTVRTPYLKAQITVNVSAIYDSMEVDEEKVADRVDQIKEYLEYFVTNEGITFGNDTPLSYEEAKSAEMDAYLDNVRKQLVEEVDHTSCKTWTTANEARIALIETASSLVGRVPYLWGGKSRKAGYDETWWTVRPDGTQNGLDCSGFVQWVYRTSGFSEDIWKMLSSTSQILQSCETISKDELLPGDIGLLNYGDSVNHCGIYLGDDTYIHCSSGKKTVTISKFPFTVFKRVQFDTHNALDFSGYRGYSLNNEICQFNVNSNVDLSYEDLYLVAQLITSEASGEGLNGQAAVAEVVLNRMRSPLFPNTVEEVIYQESDNGIMQFSDNERIQSMVPSDSTIEIAQMVFNGSLSVLGNTDILFYRRPEQGEETADWGDYPFYKRINHHSFYSKTKEEY